MDTSQILRLTRPNLSLSPKTTQNPGKQKREGCGGIEGGRDESSGGGRRGEGGTMEISVNGMGRKRRTSGKREKECVCKKKRGQERV